MAVINQIAIDGIKSRCDHGAATNQDCSNLLEYIDSGIQQEEFVCRVESAIEDAIDRVQIDSTEITMNIMRNSGMKK